LARRTFNVVDVTERVLIHWHAGRSQSQIASSLGVDRKTVKKYLAPAIGAGMVPGGLARSPEQWAELVGQWFPHLTDTKLRQITWPQIEVYRDFIVDVYDRGVMRCGMGVDAADDGSFVARHVRPCSSQLAGRRGEGGQASDGPRASTLLRSRPRAEARVL
jgi:hypothetical protein